MVEPYRISFTPHTAMTRGLSKAFRSYGPTVTDIPGMDKDFCAMTTLLSQRGLVR